jgi:cytosine deaminase
VLTAGEPRWNESGTLWEGIARWSERKPLLSHDDVTGRVLQVLRWYVANGVLHIRSHVDVTDPSLVALRAVLEVRERVRDVVNLQVVAFPQEGIRSFPDGGGARHAAGRGGGDDRPWPGRAEAGRRGKADRLPGAHVGDDVRHTRVAPGPRLRVRQQPDGL